MFMIFVFLFVILKGKIINLKFVFVIFVFMFVCVCDFGLENHKFEICVFVICVSNFGSDMTGWGGLKTYLLNGLGSGHEGGSAGQV